MNKFLKTNYKLLIGIIIGILISSISGFNKFELFLEITQIILYFISVLYFISFTLLELFIYLNKDLTHPNKDLSKLKILEIKSNSNLRSISIVMSNDNLLEGKELFKGIYNTIMGCEEFINFGYQKIVILSCTLENYKECNLHSNILLDNDTPFNDYYNEISNELTGYNNLEYGYNNLNILRFTVKV
jgi:hypothetical protein